jgi:hypothetical protein
MLYTNNKMAPDYKKLKCKCSEKNKRVTRKIRVVVCGTVVKIIFVGLNVKTRQKFACQLESLQKLFTIFHTTYNYCHQQSKVVISS